MNNFSFEIFLSSPLGLVFGFMLLCAIFGYIQSFIDLLEKKIFPSHYKEKIKKELLEEIKNNK